jgi:predicted DNA binding CopG/RHH family protein
LLASLTSPDPSPAAGWNVDDLADDVATLSYENALRTHARDKPGLPGDWGIAHEVEPQTCRACGARRSDLAASAQPEAESADLNHSAVNSSHARFTMNGSNRKSASITIRMSEGECEQLKRRAAEAGLTISAYLRSCTFEADSLRAEVKKTLAEMRKPAPPERHKEYTKARGSWFEWLLRLIPLWHVGPRVARV